jgi:pimeloyl-ACP methyl ester carboxylesterase
MIRRKHGARVTSAIAVATALALILTGCVSWFLPPKTTSTSTPTKETVSASLKPFYTQVLTWKSCNSGMQCASAKAPLDWENPAKDSIKLALIRHRATNGKPIGSLLINPGGPGASGFDFLRDNLDYAVGKPLQKNFDVVGFDPRGVGHSSAVSCFKDPKKMDSYLYDLLPAEVGTDKWITELEDSNKAFAAECVKFTGPLLGFVDTVSAARDLDLLRAILGDTKLNYLGYSYGTLLGATYADLYPEKTGKLVLDGAVDPATTNFEVSATQAQGFESALRAFLKDCFTQKDCPFSGSVDQAMDSIRHLLDSLDANPIKSKDGRELGSSSMTTAIILPLYSADNWKYLRQLFGQVIDKHDAEYAFYLADIYNDRNEDGTYSTNGTEAFIAINCLDYSYDDDLTTMRAEEAELVKLAPVLGRQLAYGGTSCEDWPFASKRDRVAIHAKGSSDILVIGTTNDPATPYIWAKNLAGELENGHLVSFTGEGHTAYNKGSSCVDKTVESYFIDGTVPTADPQC